MTRKLLLLGVLLLAFFVLGNDIMHAENNMNVFHFDFQSGFADSTTSVAINGHVVFAKKINTNPTIGLADRFDFKTANSKVYLHIKISGYECSTWLDVSKGAYLGISFLHNKIILEQQKGLFYYD